jgi:alpha-beta hydrolase superfamily lysophospholipase
MPFLESGGTRAYYRHWDASDPRAAIVFLHGFGEHTGLYHRYGFTLNAAGSIYGRWISAVTGSALDRAGTSARWPTARRWVRN